MLLFFARWVRLLGDCWVGFMVFVCTLYIIVFDVYCFTIFFLSLHVESAIIEDLGSTAGADLSLE
jgi:hypothetical protein